MTPSPKTALTPDLPAWFQALKSVARLDEVYDNLNGTMTISVECLERFYTAVSQHAYARAALASQPLSGQQSQEALSLIANLASLVRVKFGNLDDDVNYLLAHADRLLSASPVAMQQDGVCKACGGSSCKHCDARFQPDVLAMAEEAKRLALIAFESGNEPSLQSCYREIDRLATHTQEGDKQ